MKIMETNLINNIITAKEFAFHNFTNFQADYNLP